MSNNFVTLWENSDSLVDFPQSTITLSDTIENYRFYYIEYKLHKSYGNIVSTGLIPINRATTLMGAKNLLANRDNVIPSGTSLDFGSSYTWTTYAGSTSTINNAYNIPVKVVGVK